MTDAIIEEFLGTYDDSRFPEDFLQRYELLECLSSNELGETFLVKEQDTGTHYVAKCYSDRSLLSHAAESDLLKRLSCKGLPAYIGEYQNGSMRCIVREYAPGTSLDILAQEKPFTGQQVISIALQLCELLIYLHGQSPAIIHRDIKPQNILLDEQGRITLIDFGISRAYDENARADTVNFGTRHYSPPEQYGFAQTDCRSDIYSLGVLLCWLLTGSADVQRAGKTIRDWRLAKIVERCTAFAPKDRYKNAAQVRDALTGRALRRRILPGLLALSLLAAVFFFLIHSGFAQLQKPGRVTFQEPLIEQAVRLTLGKDTGAISEQDLLAVTELFVFGDQAAADEGAFRIFEKNFVDNDGVVLRGNITALDDLAKLKNLRSLYLCYQNISDLEPLAALRYLEHLDVRHNPIEDVSPLSQLPSLSSLTLFDTFVSDLTPLSRCPSLIHVDAGHTLIRSTAALEGLDSLRVLALRSAPLHSLERIGNLPLLEEIYLSDTRLLDLSPLLTLPRLQVVEVDESMRNAAEAIELKGRFEIIYR